MIDRSTGKSLSLLLRMKFHLMSIASPWKRMEHGQAIWNCKQLPLPPVAISAFIVYALLSKLHEFQHLVLYISQELLGLLFPPLQNGTTKITWHRSSTLIYLALCIVIILITSLLDPMRFRKSSSCLSHLMA